MTTKGRSDCAERRGLSSIDLRALRWAAAAAPPPWLSAAHDCCCCCCCCCQSWHQWLLPPPIAAILATSSLGCQGGFSWFLYTYIPCAVAAHIRPPQRNIYPQMSKYSFPNFGAKQLLNANGLLRAVAGCSIYMYIPHCSIYMYLPHAVAVYIRPPQRYFAHSYKERQVHFFALKYFTKREVWEYDKIYERSTSKWSRL